MVCGWFCLAGYTGQQHSPHGVAIASSLQNGGTLQDSSWNVQLLK